MHKNGNSHNCMNMNGMNSANNKNNTVNPNGANYNGFSSNGIVTKGTNQNFMSQNGYNQNFVSQNGMAHNNMSSNGMTHSNMMMNGGHMHGHNQNGMNGNGVNQDCQNRMCQNGMGPKGQNFQEFYNNQQRNGNVYNQNHSEYTFEYKDQQFHQGYEQFCSYAKPNGHAAQNGHTAQNGFNHQSGNNYQSGFNTETPHMCDKNTFKSEFERYYSIKNKLEEGTYMENCMNYSKKKSSQNIPNTCSNDHKGYAKHGMNYGMNKADDRKNYNNLDIIFDNSFDSSLKNFNLTNLTEDFNNMKIREAM